ncbi:UbiA family prenyltransferase [Patescibacteria group bacterium]
MLTKKVNKIIKIIWNEFIYGGHLQCLGVIAIAYISSFVLNIKIHWEIFLLLYLIFYPIYINDRLQGIKIDAASNPERTKHFRKYIQIMPKIIIFSILFLVLLIIIFGNLNFLIFSLILLFFGLLYPYYFKNITEKIIAFKNFYVATFFAIIVIAPVIYNSYQLDFLSSLSLAILICFVFLKVVLMQILLDCKDVEGDKSLGLLTIPVLIGREKTFIFLRILSASITTLILFIAIFIFDVFPIQMLFLLLTIPFNFYSYNLAEKQNYYGYILGSSESFFWLILILFAKAIIL